MALRPRPMHEQLSGYLYGQGGLPTQVPTPSSSARHPMAPPNADVPPGRRPIPASSEGPKKTNAQIPVARLVVKPDSAPNPFTHTIPIEGDVVMVERDLTYNNLSHAASRLGGTAGSLCRVRTLEDVDEELKRVATDLKTQFVPPGKLNPAAGDRIFPWSVDGVVNNVDNEDEFNEFKDHTIANVAVQGRCRLRIDEEIRGPIEPRSTHTLATIMVGLLEVKDLASNTYAYRLLRFTSAEIARNRNWFQRLVIASDAATKQELDPEAEAGQPKPAPTKEAHLTSVWTVGKVLDANQSPGMVTVHVAVKRRDTQILDAANLPAYQKLFDANTGAQRIGVWRKRGRADESFGDAKDARLDDGTEVRFLEEWTGRPSPVRHPEEGLTSRHGSSEPRSLASGWP